MNPWQQHKRRMAWLGMAFASHYRRRVAVSGDVYAAARQMRKQGFTLAMALTVLTRQQ